MTTSNNLQQADLLAAQNHLDGRLDKIEDSHRLLLIVMSAGIISLLVAIAIATAILAGVPTPTIMKVAFPLSLMTIVIGAIVVAAASTPPVMLIGFVFQQAAIVMAFAALNIAPTAIPSGIGITFILLNIAIAFAILIYAAFNPPSPLSRRRSII